MPAHFLQSKGLATWTEITEKMNVMDVERMIHVHHAREAQGERVRQRGDTK